MTGLMFSVVDTARKKGRVLAAYKKFIDEVTPRTAIQQFIQVTSFIYLLIYSSIQPPMLVRYDLSHPIIYPYNNYLIYFFNQFVH